jgi:transposase-like protein
MPRIATQQAGPTLSPAQIRALAALAAGQTIADAAREAGCDRGTIYRWLKNDPLFAAEYSCIRREMADSLEVRAKALTNDALDALRSLLGKDVPPAVRLKAAEMVLMTTCRGMVVEPLVSSVPEEAANEMRRRGSTPTVSFSSDW